MEKSEYYGTDLAYIHDTGFGNFARDAAPHLLQIIGQREVASTCVVDLGCGSGIWARALVDAGYEVIGVDISTSMIEMARRRVPEATFDTTSFVGFPLPRCRCVTAIGEVFNYLFDASLDTANSLAALRRICQNVFDALFPGGVLIFDIAEPGRCAGMKQSFCDCDDWACLVEYIHDRSRLQLSRRIITFRKFGDAYHRHEETHRQHLFERSGVAEMLQTIGFEVTTLQGYGEIPFPPGLVGFVATKPTPQ